MAHDISASAVSVIGLGAMGAALAAALLRAGHPVTVWNRTASKCAALEKAGARLAGSVGDAVDASPVLLVCVADYAASDALLRSPGIEARLKGKTLIQLTTGTPVEAQAAATWAEALGLAYLDGTIEGYPQHIGRPNGMILYTGCRDTFDAMKTTLDSLSGQVCFVGEAFGTAAILDGAVVGAFSLISTLGFLYGAALCDAAGVSVETYRAIAAARVPFIMDNLDIATRMIEKEDYAGTQAALSTWTAGIEQLVAFTQDVGVDSDFARQMLARLKQAVERGHGQHELAAVFECFRKPMA